jgi:DNA anti-recombination protein RmuC
MGIVEGDWSALLGKASGGADGFAAIGQEVVFVDMTVFQNIFMAVASPAMWPFAAQIADQTADEAAGDAARARVEDQIGGSTALDLGENWIWVLGIIIAIVLVLFLISAGARMRRARDAAEPIDEPLFEEQFAVRDDDAELVLEEHASDDLAEVIIEEADDDLEKLEALKENRPSSLFDDDMAEVTEAGDEPTASLKSEKDADEADSEASTEEGSEETASGDNIFELRHLQEQKEQELETQSQNEEASAADATGGDPEGAEPEQEETAQIAAFASTSRNDGGAPKESKEERNVRYASSSYKPSSISISDISDQKTGDDYEPSHGPEDMGPEDMAPMPPVEGNDGKRPYMTWYAREDMERAEQRQQERLTQLQQQIANMRQEQSSRLDLMIAALDKKLDRIAQSSESKAAPTTDNGMMRDVSKRVAALSGIVETQSQRMRAITQILDDRLGTVSHVYNEVRNVSERIDKLSENINKLENNIAERASHDMMADVQLSDVVRSSLAPDSYEFKHLLSNNHRADCMVRLPHPPGAIVIDTRFPLDAFNALPTQEAVAKNLPQAKAAEDAFRRAALRHIIDVAERFIIPGETADSALLFLPTEAVYTTLHSRFPDIVRDSFRARVWLVSPSTLMGTLQTLRGVLRDTSTRQEDVKARENAEAMKTEMEALRARASMLAQNFQSTQAELKSLLEATDRAFKGEASAKSEAKPEQKPQRDVLREQLYGGTPEWRDEENYYPGDSPSLFRDKKPPTDKMR